MENATVLLDQAQERALVQHRRRVDLKMIQDKVLRQMCLEEFQALIRPPVQEEVEPIIIEKPAEAAPVDVLKVLERIPTVELRLYAERRWLEELLSRQVPALPSNGNGNDNHLHVAQAAPVLPVQLPLEDVKVPAAPAAGPARLRIAVVGWLKEREGEVTGKLPQDVEISLVDKSRGVPAIFPVTCDQVIVYKASSDWFKLAERKYTTEKVHYVKGGAQEIIKKVMDLRSVWLAKNSSMKS